MDPYHVLGVASEASADEIHVAYRRLARRLHPDAGGSDAAQMALVNDAWRILSDPARRLAYDATVGTHPGPAVAPAPAGADGARDVGLRLRPHLQLIVITALALMFIMFVAIVLIGFGRVGVTPQP
ncbi:MAG: molecular chaperone DnaJ [Acidimicrobiaceae bacterium]|jgi:curved DNA-binding protein CbpA